MISRYFGWAPFARRGACWRNNIKIHRLLKNSIL